MIDLENKIERDKLIDDYFNKGYACDIREVYQAVVNTIADLEYANDEKVKEIDRLNNIINELKKYIEDTKQDGYKLVWINEYKNYFEAGIEEILGSDEE